MSMMIVSKKQLFRRVLFAAFLLAALFPVFAQYHDERYTDQTVNSLYTQHIVNGINLYREACWQEASDELRLALGGAETPRQSAEALYWLALSELSAGDYINSLRVLETLERFGGERSVDVPYHRGRAYYYLGYYDESIIVLNNYAGCLPERERMRKSAAYYWIGEDLLALGQIDRAREFFTLITVEYADSVKFEAASYRISIINQKKIENELLALLKWSHEESLKTTDEYRRRERNFDIAMSEYQRRLVTESRDQNDNEKLLAEYRNRIEVLEMLLAGEQFKSMPAAEQNELRQRAMQLRNDMENSARVIESGGAK